MLSKHKIRFGLLCGLPVAVVIGACGGGQQEKATGSSPPADQAVATELPPGHPAVAQPPSGMTVAPIPADTGIGKTGLTWKAPGGWTSEPPSSSMRRAQYRVSGPGGDAECVIFYFGPGQGGDAKANVERWADQFTQPDGRPSRELLQTREIEVNGIRVLMSEVSGIYSGGMAMTGDRKTLPDYMLLGAVAAGPDANWFFKFTGPRATVEAERAAFEAMIGSLQAGS